MTLGKQLCNYVEKLCKRWYNISGKGGMTMEDLITKADIENMRLLTEDELSQLNFHELCLYLGLLDKFEKKLREEE